MVTPKRRILVSVAACSLVLSACNQRQLDTSSPPDADATSTIPLDVSGGTGLTGSTNQAADRGVGPQTFVVTRVIDGETLMIENSMGVHLIGISAPKEGECGFQEARDALQTIIADRPVSLVYGTSEVNDRFGNLLRYVEVDGQDVGLDMLRAGRAVSGYTHQDDYGVHTRKQLYAQVDGYTDNANVCS